jgi:hypothetical protein
MPLKLLSSQKPKMAWNSWSSLPPHLKSHLCLPGLHQHPVAVYIRTDDMKLWGPGFKPNQAMSTYWCEVPHLSSVDENVDRKIRKVHVTFPCSYVHLPHRYHDFILTKVKSIYHASDSAHNCCWITTDPKFSVSRVCYFTIPDTWLV